ncbi:MAG: hypothetical protein ABIK77_03920 [candidate division WOR-3 bacterium]
MKKISILFILFFPFITFPFQYVCVDTGFMFPWEEACDIDCDNFGRPYIVYSYVTFSYGNNNNVRKYVIKCAYWNQGWVYKIIDSLGDEDCVISLKISVDNFNHPHILYSVKENDTTKLKYAHYNGIYWEYSTIYETLSVPDWRIDMDMSLSSNNIPYVVFPIVNFTDFVLQIKLAFKNGNDWVIETVWDSTPPRLSSWPQVAIDLDVNGNPGIIFPICFFLSTILPKTLLSPF